jgi:NADPH:quinone reductase-like Zn-dependent oxidoreductase
MKAVLFNQYGDADNLYIQDVDMPIPAAEQVLVRVHTVGLNPKDVAIRRGGLKIITGNKFPKRTGSDFSGVVTACGSAAINVAVADEVFGYLEDLEGGAMAEYVAVKPEWIAKKPTSLSHEEAATLPCAALTALQAFRDKAGLKAGQRVMIYGASGGVGSAAIQIAKSMGAHVTTVSNSANKDFCLSLGADVAYGYDTENPFADGMGTKYDVFLQVYLGGESLYEKSKQILKPSGVFVTLNPGPQMMLQGLVARVLSQPAVKNILVKSNQADLIELARLAESNKLKLPIQERFHMEDIVAAHRSVESQHTRGKIVVTVA